MLNFMKKIGLGLLLLWGASFSTVTQAENYYSVAGFDRLFGLSYEHAWDRSSAFVHGGAFFGSGGLAFDQLGFAMGYRYYLMKQAAWEDSWYAGPNIAQYYAPDFFKPGLGYELGYQWMGMKSRITLAGNLALTTDALSDEGDANIEPNVSVTFSFGYRGGSAGDYVDTELELPIEKPSLE